MRPYYDRGEIKKILTDHGYATHPKGLVEFFPHGYVLEREEAYLDVNAAAVRKGSQIPERPIRIRFHRVSTGPSWRWELKSIEELAPGAETEALDRGDTPKEAPWPD